jgi:hypothetical protein
VALPVDVTETSYYITSFNKNNFGRAGVWVSVGNDLIVVGYPLGGRAIDRLKSI